MTRVVAGVICDARGHVLVAQRGAGKHLAGTWEFPGGKLEPGERAHAALRRELHEELGIELGEVEPLISVPWSYPGKRIVLDAYAVLDYRGAPIGREGQAIAWCAVDELAELDMPPPDRPIVNALRLPDRYAISPEPEADIATFLRRVENVLSDGVRLLQLRAKAPLPRGRWEALATATRDLARRHGARVMLNGDLRSATEWGFDGVHLPAHELMRVMRRPIGLDHWLAASCHNEAEIEHANSIGVDFAVVGPVMPTASHAGVPGLGWARFAELATRAAFPVYALGGLREEHLPTARQHGAQGIAGISGFFA